MITTTTLASLSGLSAAHIRRIAHKIPGAVKAGPRAWLFDQTTALAYLSQLPGMGWRKGIKS